MTRPNQGLSSLAPGVVRWETLGMRLVWQQTVFFNMFADDPINAVNTFVPQLHQIMQLKFTVKSLSYCVMESSLVPQG